MVDKSNPNDKIELADDILLDNEEFKKSIAIPYFKDVYKDLSSRGAGGEKKDEKKKGVDSTTFLGVSHFYFYHYCSTPIFQESLASDSFKSLI